MKRAVIYLRVSTLRQVDGASLETQQFMCQEWASRNNILVEKIYHDDGVSAKTLDRPAMKEMLSDLEASRNQISYLITYQTDRLSRNAADFFALRAKLSLMGIEYKNINSNVEESINDELIQGIEAVIAQHDNRLKSTRVKENMKRQAKEGYRMSKAPLGLRNVRDVLGKSTVESVEGVAEKMSTILEAYASGAHTIAGLVILCEEISLKTASGKKMRIQAISKALRNPIYAGLEKSQHTDNQLLPSRFDGIISPSTFYRNQDLLKKNKNSTAKYKQNNPEFPLRRFLLCSNCEKPMTGSSPRSGSGTPSPRYHCSRCHLPSIKPSEMHNQFLNLLTSLKPDPGMEKFLKEMIVRVWRDETQTLATKQKRLHKTLESLTERKNKTVEMFVGGQITSDEKKALINSLDVEEAKTRKQLDEIGSMNDFKTNSIDYALQFMSNAPRIWYDASVEHRIIYQNLVFPEGLTYDLAKRQFGTAKLSSLYRLATNQKGSPARDESSLVISPGIEPGLPG